MGMNKMFKKVLAVVAAGAMTMGMAMPTFAADGGKTTEAWITNLRVRAYCSFGGGMPWPVGTDPCSRSAQE